MKPDCNFYYRRSEHEILVLLKLRYAWLMETWCYAEAKKNTGPAPERRKSATTLDFWIIGKVQAAHSRRKALLFVSLGPTALVSFVEPR